MNNSISSLYRTYLRQVRALPHVYLRHFFRIKGADDFRSLLNDVNLPVHLRKKRLKRVSKDLQRLRAANAGGSAAFDRMLDIAYGRVGKLRWELMEPFLSGPDAPLPPQVNPQKGKISSPVYSPELAALLTSSISRTTKVLQKQHLDSPPGLPQRAQSNSEDAMMLGSFSRRREHNIRWRFYRSEWKKVYPPLQISMQHPAGDPSTPPSSDDSGRAFQNVLLQELLELAGSPASPPDLTSKQRRLQPIQQMSHTNTNPFDGNLPLRWLRRRYQALLGRLPLLVSRPPSQDNSKPVYDVQIAHSAITTSRTHPSRLRAVDAEDALWISDVHLTARSAGRRRT